MQVVFFNILFFFKKENTRFIPFFKKGLQVQNSFWILWFIESISLFQIVAVSTARKGNANSLESKIFKKSLVVVEKFTNSFFCGCKKENVVFLKSHKYWIKKEMLALILHLIFQPHPNSIVCKFSLFLTRFRFKLEIFWCFKCFLN